MIQNIESNPCQACQLPEVNNANSYSIQQSYSFSYSSSIVIQADQVSLGHQGAIPSLDRFDNHMQKALEGFSDWSRKFDSMGLYPESESPASFAGRFLRSIWANFLGGVGEEPPAVGTGTETPMPVIEGGMEGMPVEGVVPVADDIVPESVPEAIVEPVEPETVAVVDEEAVTVEPEVVAVDEDVVAVEPEVAAAEEDTIPVVTESETGEEPDVVPAEIKEAIDESAKKESDKQEFVNQVEEGVDKGFQKTVKELAAENLPQKEIDTVDNAHKFIKKGLRALKNRLAGSQETNGGFIKQMGFSESNSVNLEILTQDGDVVTIGVELDMGAEVNRYRNGDTGHGMVRERAGYLNQSQSFSINGDLDEDERDAISELIGDIATLADTFYNGDMSEALFQATGLGFDTTELKGFNLDMSYQKTGYINFMPRRGQSEIAANQGRNSDLLQHAEKYARKFKNHRAFGMFQQPQVAVLDMFKAISIQKEVATLDTVDNAMDLLSALMSDEPLEEDGIQVGLNDQEETAGQIDYFV